MTIKKVIYFLCEICGEPYKLLTTPNISEYKNTCGCGSSIRILLEGVLIQDIHHGGKK